MCFLNAVYLGFGDSKAFISFVNSFCKGMHWWLVLKFYTILSKWVEIKNLVKTSQMLQVNLGHHSIIMYSMKYEYKFWDCKRLSVTKLCVLKKNCFIWALDNGKGDLNVKNINKNVQYRQYRYK